MVDKAHLTEETLGPIIDSKISEAVGWFNSKLATERERTMKYYNGELPIRQNKGSATFVSTDVYDAVESMKAQLLEVFAAGKDIIKFDPNGPEDVDDAMIASKYTDYVLFRQNDGYQIFSDVIHDGLIARVGVAKVYWDELIEYEEEEFEGLPREEAEALAEHPDVDDMDATAHDDDPDLFKGKITKKIDKSQVRIEVINPEEFSVEPQARSLNKNVFCCHKSLKTVDYLVNSMGYDRKKIDKWTAEDETTLSTNPELLARFQQIDAGVQAIDGTPLQDELRHVIVTECYAMLQFKDDKRAKPYKVVRCGHNTLEITEVDEHPFVVFTPLPIPHSFYGNNFAMRMVPTQNAFTVLTRAIVDHTSVTTNPRYQVLKGGLTNPRELLDNRLGGIVNITRPDAVTPLLQPNLNPFVFQTLQLLQQKSEETSGISSLSKGLNKDAISKQNSQGMVEDLVSLSMTRQKIIARNFAIGFLTPLWIKIYNLVIAKESHPKIVDVAGNWQPVDPSRWKERRAATVSMHLGYGELEKEAQKRVQWAVTINQDPQLSHCFQMNGRFKMAADVAISQGIYNYLDYLTPPNKVPPPQPPQPDPIAMGKVQADQTKAEAAKMQAQASMEKVQVHAQMEQMKLSLDKLQQTFENQMKLRDEKRKDTDVANKVDIEQRQMTIAESTTPTEDRVIVSPR